MLWNSIQRWTCGNSDSIPADNCYQFWPHLYLWGWKTSLCSEDVAVKFSLGRVHATILEGFHWRLLDYAKKPQCPFFRIFVLLLRPLTVNPFSLRPTPGFIQSWFCASSLEVLQLAYLNCYHIGDGKFHLGFGFNKCLVCWFLQPQHVFQWAIKFHIISGVQKTGNVPKSSIRLRMKIDQQLDCFLKVAHLFISSQVWD